MKAVISTQFGYSAEYLKADRSARTIFHILVRNQADGKQYWIKPEDIKAVSYGTSNPTPKAFCAMLQIPNSL